MKCKCSNSKCFEHSSGGCRLDFSECPDRISEYSQPVCYVSELEEAIAWIGILLNINDNPPGEHAQIIACAEEFFNKHNAKADSPKGG